MGEVFGSIAEDGRFKLWQEDITEMPNSGRRFICIVMMSSDTRVPFMSLDFKNIGIETYVALATRDGFLKVLEPIDHEDLTQWHTLFERYLCSTPDRQDETSFKVSFHHEKFPCWTAVRAGLDHKALSLAVSCMDTVKIFRSDKDRRFYHVADLKEARALVRDVSWANGAMRGWDVIATASKDGCIRIYELHTDPGTSSDGFGSSSIESSTLDRSSASLSSHGRGRAQNVPSGIGAGLAGTQSDRDRGRESEGAPGRIKESATMVEEINLHRGAIWKVAFSQGGELQPMAFSMVFADFVQVMYWLQRATMEPCTRGKELWMAAGTSTPKWTLLATRIAIEQKPRICNSKTCKAHLQIDIRDCLSAVLTVARSSTSKPQWMIPSSHIPTDSIANIPMVA